MKLYHHDIGNEIYVIKTQITLQGAQIAAKQQVEKHEKLTRKKRLGMQYEDEVYYAVHLIEALLTLTRYAPLFIPSNQIARDFYRMRRII